jgi:hypothetical protein
LKVNEKSFAAGTPRDKPTIKKRKPGEPGSAAVIDCRAPQKAGGKAPLNASLRRLPVLASHVDRFFSFGQPLNRSDASEQLSCIACKSAEISL